MFHLSVIQRLRGRLYGPLREAFGQAVEISSMQITTLLWWWMLDLWRTCRWHMKEYLLVCHLGVYFKVWYDMTYLCHSANMELILHDHSYCIRSVWICDVEVMLYMRCSWDLQNLTVSFIDILSVTQWYFARFVYHCHLSRLFVSLHEHHLHETRVVILMTHHISFLF